MADRDPLHQGSAAARPGALGSLRSQLLRWLLLPLVLLVAVNTVSVYRNALAAADFAYDRTLLASARAIAERVTIRGGRVVADVPYLAIDSFETDTLGRIYYRIVGVNGELVSGYGDLPPPPPQLARSDAYPALVRFYDATYRQQPLRIAALHQPLYDDSMRGIALIQVGETREARRALSDQILFDTLWTQAELVSAAALLAWFAVRFALRPLMRWKRDVELRGSSELSDFDASLVHREMRPLVVAMNGYMGRLQQLISGQRRFIADASHQLRTPLTVLKMQAEMALRENDTEAMRQIVRNIASTTDSTVHLANRLLTLARAGHDTQENIMEQVSLTAIARQAGLEMGPAAVKKNLDLSLEAEGDVIITGNPFLLHELSINLLDNAIRYTPAGGQVTLRVAGKHACRDRAPQAGRPVIAVLQVEDSGIGIAHGERTRVFAPFYRSAGAQHVNSGGAGLGLTIVRDIADLHGAAITLDDRAELPGLVANVLFCH